MKIHVVLTVCALLALPLCAQETTNTIAPQIKMPTLADKDMASAKALFEKYVKLENDFDPALADLFAADAKIFSSVKYEDGMTRAWGTPVQVYKESLRQNMPLIKKLGDVPIYTNVSYTAEGAGIRIKAERVLSRSKAYNRVSYLVGAGGDGKWTILEYVIQALAGGNHGIRGQEPPSPSGPSELKR